MIEIVIPGPFRGQARPRFNTKTGTAFTKSEDTNYRNWIRNCFYHDTNEHKPFEEALEVTINIHYEITKSTSKKMRAKMLAQQVFPTKKPDLDNITKIILDALNGIAYKDDKQVVRLIVNKFYSEVAPMVVLNIKEL